MRGGQHANEEPCVGFKRHQVILGWASPIPPLNLGPWTQCSLATASVKVDDAFTAYRPLSTLKTCLCLDPHCRGPHPRGFPLVRRSCAPATPVRIRGSLSVHTVLFLYSTYLLPSPSSSAPFNHRPPRNAGAKVCPLRLEPWALLSSLGPEDVLLGYFSLYDRHHHRSVLC
jgi:hypothetical protein